jgi:hypothetical protein
VVFYFHAFLRISGFQLNFTCFLGLCSVILEYSNVRISCNLPHFPIHNTHVIYTKTFSKREKTTIRIMQLKLKNFQIIYITMYTII